MRKRKIFKRDVDECQEKINAILNEYNCKIDIDKDLYIQDGSPGIIVVDNDTHEFEIL